MKQIKFLTLGNHILSIDKIWLIDLEPDNLIIRFMFNDLYCKEIEASNQDIYLKILEKLKEVGLYETN